MTPVVATRVRLGGRVQGVGFRPFVYRLAMREGVAGWVRNLSGQVEILAQGPEAVLLRFTASLLHEAPPLARPLLISVVQETVSDCPGFLVRASEAADVPDVHVPPDQFTCDDCLRDLSDPRDRRYGYPFINCTQCGPRYTLITRLPYDRVNTTMAGFGLCPACAAEYADPADRRFHAEPVACPACGPVLRFGGADGEDALQTALDALQAGLVLAVKGIGGYHLVCDALNADAITVLRRRKHRPHKPLAVMVPSEGWLDRLVCPTDDERALLVSPMRPIVLVRKRSDAGLPDELAPGLDQLGIMLPYSPLHHLLLQRYGGPLVATSANPPGEPVLTDGAMVERRLGDVVDGFLHHDRPIVRHADDPVYRVVAGRGRPIRLGRGNAPAEHELSFALKRPILALGGQMKVTVALGWGRRAVVSPHLGDMDTPRGVALLRQTAEDLQALYGVQAEMLCRDAHPGYASTRVVRNWERQVVPVFHHAAHASALVGEYDAAGDWIVFTWDGAGLGPDGTIWGGEALVGGSGRWQRRASVRAFGLPGGDKVAHQPWRSACALAWESGHGWMPDGQDVELLHQAWARGVNCPQSTSVGRMFDAAAAMLGLVTVASFEGQAAMAVEASAVAGDDPGVDLPLARTDGIWRSDWAPLLPLLCDAGRSVGNRAGMFHATMAGVVVAQAVMLRAETGIGRIGLTGGVFQNRLLTEAVVRRAQAAGFSVFVPERLPCNDAGLSFGQLIEANACL